jgi:hypothetical protein
VKWEDKYHPVFEDRWDDNWWAILKNICDLLAQHDMTAVITLVDDCNIRYVNMVDTFKKGLQPWRQLWKIDDFYSDKMRGHFADFLEPLILTLKSSQVDYDIELVNELFFPKEADTTDHRYIWLEWLSDHLRKTYGIGKDRLWFSGGPNWGLFQHMISYYCPHQIVTADSLRTWRQFSPAFPSGKIILSGDGGDGRDIVHGKPFGYHVIKVDDAMEIADEMKDRGIYGYEYWLQLSNKNDADPYLSPLRAMNDILQESITSPSPPLPPIPPKPPIQKPCSYWFKRLNFKRWLKCILGK